MAKSVILLTRAYRMTGDEDLAKKAVDYIKTWFLNPETMVNPNMDHG